MSDERIIKDDVLLSRTILTERLEQARAWVDDRAPFFGGNEKKVADYLLATWEHALDDAGEPWVSTSDASAAVGWHDSTLQRWARAKLDGKPLPPPWDRIEVKATHTGFIWRVSTIPLGRQSA